MHFTENFALFNLLKLLGGISSAQQSADEKISARPNDPPTDGGKPKDGSPPPQEERHNVMADVIERHERIANRARHTQ